MAEACRYRLSRQQPVERQGAHDIYAGDPRRFSQSKTLVRAARAEGVDLGDAKALDAFVKRFRRRLARDPSLLPASGPLPRKAFIWTPGQPVPDPQAACPCGSGKRYRKCCMPR